MLVKSISLSMFSNYVMDYFFGRNKYFYTFLNQRFGFGDVMHTQPMSIHYPKLIDFVKFKNGLSLSDIFIFLYSPKI